MAVNNIDDISASFLNFSIYVKAKSSYNGDAMVAKPVKAYVSNELKAFFRLRQSDILHAHNTLNQAIV